MTRENTSEINDPWKVRRENMVTRDIVRRGVTNAQVLRAMRTVPRHAFVHELHKPSSYNDYPLPIGFDQTISQPFIVAAMTEALSPGPGEKVLEIGTGCGYQAAVLAEIYDAVYTIEIIPELAARAKKTCEKLGYTNIHVRCGDGYRGWPSEAPFDGIIVTCAPEDVPQPLIDQLAEGGRIVIPVGGDYSQELIRLTKEESGLKREKLMGVRFVPMTGEAEKME